MNLTNKGYSSEFVMGSPDKLTFFIFTVSIGYQSQEVQYILCMPTRSCILSTFLLCYPNKECRSRTCPKTASSTLSHNYIASTNWLKVVVGDMEENLSLLFLLILTENGTEHGLRSPLESLYFKETIESCSS